MYSPTLPGLICESITGYALVIGHLSALYIMHNYVGVVCYLCGLCIMLTSCDLSNDSTYEYNASKGHYLTSVMIKYCLGLNGFLFEMKYCECRSFRMTYM